MADIELIKPRELPEQANVQATDALMVDNGTVVGKATPEKIVNAGAPVASEAEALAGVNNTKRMTPLRTRQVLDNVNNPAVLRAQAWAESSTPPDPLLPDSKSAKTWASIAEQGTVMVQWSMIAAEGQTVLGSDITTGEPIRAFGGVAQISVNGFGPITPEEYSVDSDGVVTLTAPLAEGDVVSGFTQPRLSNSEAQAVVQGVLQQTGADVAAAQEAADRAEEAAALFEFATKSEAEEGVVNDKGMTPLRTRQALDIRGYVKQRSLDFYGGRDFAALKLAISDMNSGLIEQLVIPTGITTINRASISPKTSTILVISAGMIIFEPGAQINFDYIGTPLFTFLGASSGGIVGRPKFRFTGSTPTTPDVTRAQFYAASGFPSDLSFGGDYELWSLILSNSDNLAFEDFDVESASPGAEAKIIPFVFNLKPKSSSIRAKNNFIRRAHGRDFQHGLLHYGQDGGGCIGFDSDRRAGVAPIAPGHVVYSTGSGLMRSTGFVVDGINDGPNPINWPGSAALNLATLAPKGCESCDFKNVVSRHPSGIIQSLDDTDRNIFDNFTHMTEDATLGFAPEFNAVNSNTNSIFSNFVIKTPNKPFRIAQTSSGTMDGSVFENWYIEADANLPSGSGSLIEIYGSKMSLDIRFRPTKPLGATHQRIVDIRGASSQENVLDVTVLGPNQNPALRRAADNGLNNSIRIGERSVIDNQDMLFYDAILNVASRGTLTLSESKSVRGYFPGLGPSAPQVQTFQLPGRGYYDLFVDVTTADHLHGRAVVYGVLFSGQAATYADAALKAGPVVRGSNITSLTVSVDSNGLVSVTYAKTSSANCTVSVGYSKLGSIAE